MLSRMALISWVQVNLLPLLHKQLGQQVMYTTPDQSEELTESGTAVGHRYSSAVKHETEHVQTLGSVSRKVQEKLKLLNVQPCLQGRL